MNHDMILAMPSVPELLIVLAIVLVIFGGAKIPKLMGGFGKGIKEFKKAVNDDSSEPSNQEEAKLAEAKSQKQLSENSES